MSEEAFDTSGTWRQTTEGWVYEAKTVLRRRVVATARSHLAYSVAYTLVDLLGKEGVDEVEESTRDLCERLATLAEGD